MNADPVLNVEFVPWRVDLGGDCFVARDAAGEWTYTRPVLFAPPSPGATSVIDQLAAIEHLKATYYRERAAIHRILQRDPPGETTEPRARVAACRAVLEQLGVRV